MRRGTSVVGDDGGIDDGEKVFRGAAGDGGLEPVEAFPIVGVEEGELGGASAHGVAGAANFVRCWRDGAGLLREKRMEAIRKGGRCAVAGDGVVAFGEDERDARFASRTKARASVFWRVASSSLPQRPSTRSPTWSTKATCMAGVRLRSVIVSRSVTKRRGLIPAVRRE